MDCVTLEQLGFVASGVRLIQIVEDAKLKSITRIVGYSLAEKPSIRLRPPEGMYPILRPRPFDAMVARSLSSTASFFGTI